MNQKWISMLAAMVAVVAGLLVGVMVWWSSNHDPKPAGPGAQLAATSSVPVEAMPAPAAGPLTAPGLAAQQAAAAKEIELEPAMKPITGPVKERPAFVSEMEWQMLKGVAQQNAAPDMELTRLVNNLRFMKQLELWQGLGKSTDVAKRQTLAEQLLADLPQRVLSGEMGKPDAQKLQADLIKDAVSDPQARKLRAEAEARRLSA